jgi:hypothetical protein
MHTARQLASTRLRSNRGIAPARWASGTQPLSTQENAADEYGKKRLLCQGCTNTIAHEDDPISIQGKHEHNCTKPHGVRFRIGCFREAAGGVAIGERPLNIPGSPATGGELCFAPVAVVTWVGNFVR